MSYSIVYSSQTGTQSSWQRLFGKRCRRKAADYFGTPAQAAAEADTLYVGFWTDRGHADADCNAFLKTLRGKKGLSVRHRRLRRQRGVFCKDPERRAGGAGPQQYRCGDLYVSGPDAPVGAAAVRSNEAAAESSSNLDMLIENFDRALAHPDAGDLERLKQAVQ